MATNKFATMSSSNKITRVLVYAILEWILISLLLVNSFLSFLISKFANYYGLKPPCTFCSRLDHVLDGNEHENFYKDLICEEHAYQVSKLGYCPDQQKPIFESKSEEKNESEALERKDENESCADDDTEPQIYNQDNDFSVEGVVDDVEEKKTSEVFEKMEIGELVSSIIMTMQDLISVATEEAQSPCTEASLAKGLSEIQEMEGREADCRLLNGEFELEFLKGMESSSPRGLLDQIFEDRDGIGTSNSPDISVANNEDQELNEAEAQKLLPFENGEFETRNSCGESILSGTEFGDDAMTIEELKTELKAKQEALNALYVELEEERNASAVAASQTMTMMSRLQQEKAAMQMEARQYQRMMEEQSEYDQEALQLLNDLMVKKEKEKQELEKELEIYRKRVLDYEAEGQVTVMPEDDDDMCTDTESVFEEMGTDPVKNMSLIDESLREFEVERLSILEELKALEIKLVTLTNDEEQPYEDINPSGYHTDCAQSEDNFCFVGPNGNAMIVNAESKKSIPFYDGNETMNEGQIESSSTNKIKCLDFKFKMVNKRVTIEEEMCHIYERLHGLETDKDFLKQIIGSLSEGDEGINLLREILQHLRDLRTVEVCARSIYDGPLS